MRTALVILMAGASLAACSTNTKGSWSCGAQRGTSCSSIAQMDGSIARDTQQEQSPGIESAEPVRWWEPKPFVFSDAQGARREGDQVLRLVFAPWVDAQGDYHERSIVRAVVRRGGWVILAPSTAEASATLSSVGRNAVQPE